MCTQILNFLLYLPSIPLHFSDWTHSAVNKMLIDTITIATQVFILTIVLSENSTEQKERSYHKKLGLFFITKFTVRIADTSWNETQNYAQRRNICIAVNNSNIDFEFTLLQYCESHLNLRNKCFSVESLFHSHIVRWEMACYIMRIILVCCLTFGRKKIISKSSARCTIQTRKSKYNQVCFSLQWLPMAVH